MRRTGKKLRAGAMMPYRNWGNPGTRRRPDVGGREVDELAKETRRLTAGSGFQRLVGRAGIFTNLVCCVQVGILKQGLVNDCEPQVVGYEERYSTLGNDKPRLSGYAPTQRDVEAVRAWSV